jgi:hypothetical protein
MNCQEFARQTEQWMEGERSAEAREHAIACPRCGSFVEELDAIRLVAPQLAEDVAPPPRLWTALRAQLEREKLIRQPGWREELAGWFRLPVRPLATVAAAAMAVALAVFVVLPRGQRVQTPQGPNWLSSDQPELARVDTQLDHVESGAIRSLHTTDPAVSDTLRQNLMIVNRQIAMCEKTLEQAPSDENTRDYLYDAYQQKADLLNMMAERGSAAAE